MNIFFVGQKGIPMAFPSPREERVEELAVRLAKEGHSVTVACAKPAISSSISNYKGVTLKHYSSINPTAPGGWLPLLASLVWIWRQQPQVVHIHSWKAASLVRLAALLSPETTFIWTIDVLPQTHQLLASLIAWQAQGVFDSIVSPSRNLQYWLLQEYGLRTVYIPDGYSVPAAPLTKTPLKVKAKKYVFTTATQAADIKLLAKVWKKSKIRTKIVFIQSDSKVTSVWLKRYPFLVPMPVMGPRQISALLAGAEAMLVLGAYTAASLVLQAMEAGKPIFSANLPFYEEILGVYATFVPPHKRKELENGLVSFMKSLPALQPKAAKAQKRARIHFNWASVTAQYQTLYHYPKIQRVPLDSVQPHRILEVKTVQ